MGSLIFGINVKSKLQNVAPSIIRMVKATQIPRLKGIAFLNPSLLPLDIDMILLGPGVAAVVMAYVKK